MEIVESEPAAEPRPWEPPIWLLALGLCTALVIGVAQSQQVRDPRLVNAPSPTPCVAFTQNVWTLCP